MQKQRSRNEKECYLYVIGDRKREKEKSDSYSVNAMIRITVHDTKETDIFYIYTFHRIINYRLSIHTFLETKAELFILALHKEI